MRVQSLRLGASTKAMWFAKRVDYRHKVVEMNRDLSDYRRRISVGVEQESAAGSIKVIRVRQSSCFH